MKHRKSGRQSSCSNRVDALGREIARIDELRRRTEYRYDALGRLVFTVYPDATPENDLDNPRVQTTYDAIGQIVAEFDERGNKTEFEFDSAGRQTVVRNALGYETISIYDVLVGRLLNTIHSETKPSFNLNAAGRNTKTILADSTSISVSIIRQVNCRPQSTKRDEKTQYDYDLLGD